MGFKILSKLTNEGMASLERGYTEGVSESLLLMSTLLGFQPVPKIFQLRHNDIYATIERNEQGHYVLEPIVIYNKMDNTLTMLETRLSGPNAKIIEVVSAVSSGEKEPSFQGAEVFQNLAQSVEIKPLLLDDDV